MITSKFVLDLPCFSKYLGFSTRGDQNGENFANKATFQRAKQIQGKNSSPKKRQHFETFFVANCLHFHLKNQFQSMVC
jgi:hypothetical protein